MKVRDTFVPGAGAWRSTTSDGKPDWPNVVARARPDGPAPTIRTSTEEGGVMMRLLIGERTANNWLHAFVPSTVTCSGWRLAQPD